jgi:hypothetical protein
VFWAEDGSEQIVPASEKTSAGNALKRIWQKRLGP